MVRYLTQLYFAIYYLLERKICSKPRLYSDKSKVFLWLVLTAGPVLNVRFLLEYVFFRDARHCDGCTEFKRQGVLLVVGIFISFLIMLSDMYTSPSDAPTPAIGQRLWWGLLAYEVFSVLVALMQ
jgi:quinol-cytochrome oxidoreductase complex cytochrome b subunit